jgi:hypothetical protein
MTFDVAKEIRMAPVVEMSRDMAMAFLQMTMMDRESPESLLKTAKETGLLEMHPYQVLTAHLEHRLPTVPVSMNVKAFLVCLCLSNMAKISMMAAAIAQEVEERQITNFTMRELAFMFPMGFPSDEVFTQIWDKNKQALRDAKEQERSANAVSS